MPDFGRRITTESFYEGRADVTRVEIEESILTSHDKLLSDLVDCLTVLKGRTTPHLTITIHMDDYGHPKRLSRTYVESYEKRL